MKALVYRDPGLKALQEHSKPQLQAQDDAIVKIVKTTICGTDLHILKGDVPSCTPGRILGHEGIHPSAPAPPHCGENVTRQLFQYTMPNLAHAQGHSLLLGRRGAAEKVAAFLLGWAGHSAQGRIVISP